MRTKTQIRATRNTPVVPMLADAPTTGRLISVAEMLHCIAAVAEVNPGWTWQEYVDEAQAILAESDQPTDAELVAMVEAIYPGLHVGLTPDLTH